MRILHIITALGTGGAERVLQRLVRPLATRGIESVVLSMMDTGPIGRELEDSGIPVFALGMRRGRVDTRSLKHLRELIYTEQPDLVQTWMYHADLVGGLAARIWGKHPVLWNIRHTALPRGASKVTTRATMRVCAMLSPYIPDRIICCSESACHTHVALGYDQRQMQVIPNGCDTELFRPDPEAREQMRSQLGATAGQCIIGMIARFHPQKDYATFFEAARLLVSRWPRVVFCLCGAGVTPNNAELRQMAETITPGTSIKLLGERADIERLVNAFDVATLSSSTGEGFPNVLAEAMSCGVPCVATDVGDSARIIGDTGIVVPPRSPEALAAAWEHLLRMPAAERRELGQQARARVLENFSLDKMVDGYATVYRQVLAQQETNRRRKQ